MKELLIILIAANAFLLGSCTKQDPTCPAKQEWVSSGTVTEIRYSPDGSSGTQQYYITPENVWFTSSKSYKLGDKIRVNDCVTVR